jgi:hypothetical protein
MYVLMPAAEAPMTPTGTKLRAPLPLLPLLKQSSLMFLGLLPLVSENLAVCLQRNKGPFLRLEWGQKDHLPRQ